MTIFEVELPDGIVVRGAGLPDRGANRQWRDRGLYLDARWAPTWPAELVDWPDLGIPTNGLDAANAIRRAVEHARAGANVEVGCVGGIGRTGTAIACMAVLAGVARGDAVAWTRRRATPHAIETSAQERWVSWFADHAADQGWIVAPG